MAGDDQWAVYVIDVGCDCCSYLVRAIFDTKAEAERWVAESLRPSDYYIEEW